MWQNENLNIQFSQLTVKAAEALSAELVPAGASVSLPHLPHDCPRGQSRHGGGRTGHHDRLLATEHLIIILISSPASPLLA